MNPKKLIKSAFLIIVLAYFGFGILLYFFQEDYVYFPSTETMDDKYTYTAIRSDNETLKIWVVNPNQNEAIIYFGGNATNVYNAIPQFEQISTTKTTYLVNYRGYGGSTGKPSQKGLTIDALNIYDFVQDHHTSISAIGRSLGTGVAAYLASNRSLDKLVLVTPYDSTLSVAQGMYPMYPLSYLMNENFDSLSLVDSISEPTLILISETDNVVPLKHAHNLADAFKPDQVTVYTIPESNHRTITTHPDYIKRISDFL